MGCDWMWNHSSWFMICNPTVSHSTCITQYSYSSGVANPYLHGSHWTNLSPGGDIKLVQKTPTMTAKHVWGVMVVGEALMHGVFHTCQAWSMHHVQNSWNSGITYTDLYDPPWTTPPPGESAVFKPYSITPSRLIAKHVQDVFEGEIMILDVFLTYQIWSMYHPHS